jgi:hypothetical protein
MSKSGLYPDGSRQQAKAAAKAASVEKAGHAAIR